jgi:hypothetical protein
VIRIARQLFSLHNLSFEHTSEDVYEQLREIKNFFSEIVTSMKGGAKNDKAMCAFKNIAEFLKKLEAIGKLLPSHFHFRVCELSTITPYYLHEMATKKQMKSACYTKNLLENLMKNGFHGALSNRYTKLEETVHFCPLPQDVLMCSSFLIPPQKLEAFLPNVIKLGELDRQTIYEILWPEREGTAYIVLE